MMRIEDDLAACYFNRAVFLFGARLEAEIRKIEGKHKSQVRQSMAIAMLMSRWLGDAPGQFRR